MKIRIVKAASGAFTSPKPTKKELQAKDNLYGKDKAYWRAAYVDLNKALEDRGMKTIDPDKMTVSQYQDILAKNFPDTLLSQIKSGEMPLTEKHRKLLGTSVTTYDQLTPAQQRKIKDETLLSGFTDQKQGFRTANLDADGNPIDIPDYDANAFTQPTDAEKAEWSATEGNKYGFKDNGAKKKPYQKEQMPFYQTIPELMGFASSLNTYNYQTPDYQHWEMTPNKLNVQPQIQSIDSSLNAVTNTTTGSPQLDYARKMGAFTQATNAKQQVYGNKQNYDAEKEFQASQFNNTARTQERNLDINAQNQIYNEFMPLAKDAAAGERIAAISSLTTKYAKHAANENKKKLWLDNFYKNVQVNPDGTIEAVGTHDFSEEFQAISPKKISIKNPMTGEKIDVIPPMTNPDKVGPITGYKIPGTGTTPRINNPKRPFSIIQDVPVEEEATNIFGVPNILPSSIRKNRNSR